MKKFLPYILILIVLVGLFSPGGKANAQSPDGTGTCYRPGFRPLDPKIPTNLTETQCGLNVGYDWIATGATAPSAPITAYQDCLNTGGTPASCGALSGAPTPASEDQSAYDTAVKENTCGFIGIVGGTVQGCILQFLYWTFYTLGGWLLAIAASFFNFFIRITLDSELLQSDFISHAWGIVRDLSNIFFILILLYIAIKIILSLGGSDVKKMIANVIIMALLINFSMFMTKVVIDTSNILALIFYNKINTTDKKNSNAVASLIDYATGEKDLAGGLTQSFNPVYNLDKTFFEGAGNIKIPGGQVTGPASTATLIGITVIAGAIMIFAAYALFISALSFLGRLIELFILIIASPFAFMSFAMPPLKSRDYIGWDSWLKRLLATAFMAPIFMFFLYFIFLLLGANMFTDSLKPKGEGTISILLSIIIPALVILTLLLRATSFAKRGSGHFGEMIIKGGQIAAGVVGGVTLGAATGGAALALRGTVGRAGAAMANSERMKNWEARGWGGGYARSAAKAIGSRSFDIRQAPGAGALAKMGGIDLGAAKSVGLGPKEGGFEQTRKNQVRKRMERAQSLEVGEDERLKQHLNTMETDLQAVLNANIGRIEKFDQDIKDAKEINDPTQIRAAIDAKKAFVDALSVNTIDSTGRRITTTVGGAGGLKENIFNKKSEIIEENRNRKWKYAKTTEGIGGRIWRFVNPGYSHKGAKEAAYKIRMEQKIDTGEKS